MLTSFQKTFFHGPKPQVATLAKETVPQSKANPQIEPGPIRMPKHNAEFYPYVKRKEDFSCTCYENC